MHNNMTQTVDDRKIVQAERDDGMVAISWKDKGKKPTNFLTNMYTAAALIYTEMGMGCVDTFNHLLVGCTPKRRNFSWKRAAFMSLLSFTLVNIWVVYSQSTTDKVLEQPDFLDVFKYQFIQVYQNKKEEMKIINKKEKYKGYNLKRKERQQENASNPQPISTDTSTADTIQVSEPKKRKTRVEYNAEYHFTTC